VGGQVVHLGGIGNIATKVEWRKRGYASEALRVAVDFLKDPLQVDFGLMIATENMVGRYAKTGWRQVAGAMMIEQPEGRRAFSIPILVLPVQKTDWPQGMIDLQGLPW
jgi:predicted acetyltransferase